MLAFPMTPVPPEDPVLLDGPGAGGGASVGLGTQAARSAAAPTAKAASLMEARRRAVDVTIVGGDRLRDG